MNVLVELPSPILVLKADIAKAPFALAPERQEELRGRVAHMQIKFRTDRRDISVAVDTGEISLGFAALEQLWASAYWYHVFYDEYGKAQRRLETKFDYLTVARTSTAFDLLNWSIRKHVGYTQDRWPDHFPKPELHPLHASDIHVANELFLCAVAWTIHHEIAHVLLQHPGIDSENSQREEREADLVATDWILAFAPTPEHLRKRVLGVIVAILALDTIEFSIGDPASRTHPTAYERLAYCLVKYAAADDDEAFAFALCGLQFSLAQRNIELPLDAPSFRHLLDEFFLARHRHRQDIS
jgi:hypothetical protein